MKSNTQSKSYDKHKMNTIEKILLYCSILLGFIGIVFFSLTETGIITEENPLRWFSMLFIIPHFVYVISYLVFLCKPENTQSKSSTKSEGKQ